MRMHSACAALIALSLGCAAAPQSKAPVVRRSTPPTAKANAPAALPSGSALYEPQAECTRPNVEDADGTPACVHMTPADMPLRIAVGFPRLGAKYANRKDTRVAAVEGIRLWEEALRPRVPWFRLEFVEEDSSAPVQVVWKRRMTGNAAGRGWMMWAVGAEGLRVQGKIEATLQPYLPHPVPLEIGEVRMLMAHEFGHVLGLGHSLDDDSAMNYSWHTRDRIFVTDHDVDSFPALVNQPSGLRVDGTPLAGL